jgi:N utilization substance protein B
VATGRRSARRQAVFILYQQDLLKLDADSALSRTYEVVNDFALAVVRGVEERKTAIDSLLSEHLSGWSLARVGVLERAILRVAAYELLAEPTVPVAVVIDQAVGLAKRFCSGEASALVNGILGGVAKTVRPGPCVEEEERTSGG